jgi:hypothetical protein
MAGYSEIAAIMAKNPESAVFKRFQGLHARINLFLQADLVCLEEELDDIVNKAMQPDTDGKLAIPAEEGLDVSWETTRCARTVPAKAHRDKIMEIQEKLETYCKCLCEP